ncbi:MAG TPA: hypothetical protein VMS87_09195 [Roseiarcus sp.]|nr:hypothetical protein [Roseiarcus sp.]
MFKVEPPQPSPIPVLALGARKARPARTPHGASIAANPPGHASPPGDRVAGGDWSLPTDWLGSEKLHQLGPSPAGHAMVRHAPQAPCVLETAREGYRGVQKHVLHLGEINGSQELAWRRSIEVLDEEADRPKTPALFPEDRCEGILPDDSIVRLKPSQLRLRRAGQRGACWLALSLWEGLQLDDLVGPQRLALGSGAFRAGRLSSVGAGQRMAIASGWSERTALADLLGGDFGLAEIHKL